jgi:hypothetical protein
MFPNVGQNIPPESRADLRDAIQAVAQNFWNRTGMGVHQAPPPPPRPDYTPVIIASLATIMAAIIITGRK